MTTWEEIISSGDVNAVKDYISQGADVNATDKYGETALYYAQRCGRDDVVALLGEK